ncbi:phage regulatory CII family protein [Paraburkholderia sp. BR14263]|uniref:phage regulatory CII family protein n=1 Tax=unclassified Paraburkholderia TaxID=2615204 RepID=UPI0034CF84A9
MNTADAAYAVAHDYPGGTEALGPRMGITPAVLRNKVNRNRDPENRNVLSLAQAVAMTDLSNDERILEAWAAQRNAVLVKLPDAQPGDHDALVSKFNELYAELGDLSRDFSRFSVDNEIDSAGMGVLEADGMRAIRTVEELLMLIRKLYAREAEPGSLGKPTGSRVKVLPQGDA